MLSKALSEASKNDLVIKNVCKAQTAPKVEDSEVVIVPDIPALLAEIEGERLFSMAILGLFAGMRLGEILAVRDNTLDLEAKAVKVREALEQTKAHGIRFKAPKSKAGRRDISLPDVAVDALSEQP